MSAPVPPPHAINPDGHEPVRYSPAPQFMPSGPMGGSRLPALEVDELVAMGAQAGAAGLTRQAVAELVSQMQAASMQAQLMMLPKVMASLGKVQEAQLNRIIQCIKLLPEAPMTSQGMVSRFINGPQTQQLASYVNRNEVLLVIQEVLAENRS